MGVAIRISESGRDRSYIGEIGRPTALEAAGGGEDSEPGRVGCPAATGPSTATVVGNTGSMGRQPPRLCRTLFLQFDSRVTL